VAAALARHLTCLLLEDRQLSNLLVADIGTCWNLLTLNTITTFSGCLACRCRALSQTTLEHDCGAVLTAMVLLTLFLGVPFKLLLHTCHCLSCMPLLLPMPYSPQVGASPPSHRVEVL
jgi:hypothetical protein